MTTIVSEQTITVSSDSGTPQNGTKNSMMNFTFPEIVGDYNTSDYCEVEITAVNIPASVYNVPEGRNNFWLTDGNGVPSDQLTIPPGCYCADTLTKMIQRYLPTGYTITYNFITRRFSLFAAGPFGISTSLTTMNSVLGLGNTGATLYSTQDQWGGWLPIVFPCCYDLRFPRLYFCSNAMDLSNYTTSSGQQNMLFSIFPNTFSIDNDIPTKNRVLTDAFDNFDIFVTLADGTLADFNGAHWCFDMLIRTTATYNNTISTRLPDHAPPALLPELSAPAAVEEATA